MDPAALIVKYKKIRDQVEKKKRITEVFVRFINDCFYHSKGVWV